MENKINGFEGFIRKILKDGTDSFTCYGRDDWELYAVQRRVGNAKYVYTMTGDGKINTSISRNISLSVIVSGGRAYLIDSTDMQMALAQEKDYIMDTIASLPDDLKGKVTLILDYVAMVRERMYTAALEFMSGLDDIPLVRNDINIAKRKAVWAITYQEDLDAVIRNVLYRLLPDSLPVVKEQDAVDELCGVRDLLSEARSSIRVRREEWSKTRSLISKIKEYMENPSMVMTEAEIRIGSCLRRSRAKNVRVHFFYGDKEAWTKLDREHLLKTIANGLSIGKYDFGNPKEYELVVDKFGCGRNPRDANRLTVEHISEIIYGGKVLYRKGK